MERKPVKKLSLKKETVAKLSVKSGVQAGNGGVTPSANPTRCVTLSGYCTTSI
jgi:hypothetical protein